MVNAGKFTAAGNGSFSVMAGHSRPKDSVAAARLGPAIHGFSYSIEPKDVDARHKAGHDELGADQEAFAVWMPHSVLGRPRQRPARASSSGEVRLVQGMQPIERKPLAASGCGGNPAVA